MTILVRLDEVKMQSTYVFVERRHGTRVALGRLVAGTIGHVGDLLVRAWSAHAGVGDLLDELAVPVLTTFREATSIVGCD